MTLVDSLQQYVQHGRRRFHVPGHAGSFLGDPHLNLLGLNAYQLDLTELDGLDVLSEPEGILKDAQKKAATIFGARETFFLVNGATVGLMAAMLCCLKPQDKVILPRNVHRSMINGLVMTGAQPVWLLPDDDYIREWGIWGETPLASIKQVFAAHPDAKAVILPSPTYEGMASNSDAIARFCKANHLFLIVDEAHGSLWPFSGELPPSALQASCDVVVHSLHKSGGSLTQSALAHLPYHSGVEPEAFQQALNLLHTTSPSYLLLSSLDSNIAFWDSPAGRECLKRMLDLTWQLREGAGKHLHHIELLTPEQHGVINHDPCKLLLRVPGIATDQWTDWLEQDQQIAYESVNGCSSLYLANPGLTGDDFKTFFEALRLLDNRSCSGMFNATDRALGKTGIFHLPSVAMTPREAFFACGERIRVQEAVGRIARETIVHCPPGIPVMMPGEIISAEQLLFVTTETIAVVC